MCFVTTSALSYSTNDDMIQTWINSGNRGKISKEPCPHPHMSTTSSLYIFGPRQKIRPLDTDDRCHGWLWIHYPVSHRVNRHKCMHTVGFSSAFSAAADRDDQGNFNL